MTDKAVCKISGDEAVSRMFSELPAAAQDRVMKPLLTRGAKRLAEAERSEVPTETGLIKLAIGSTGVKIYGTGEGGKVMFLTAGVRRGFRRAVTANKQGGLRKRSKAFTETAESSNVRNPVKYIRLVTKGRKAVTAKKKKFLYSSQSGKFFGRSAAAVAPNPFVSRAFANAQSGVISDIQAGAGDGIAEQAARLAK